MIDVHGVLLLSPANYYLLSSIITAVALACLYFMLTRLRRARWLEDTPTSKVRSAAQGLVELHTLKKSLLYTIEVEKFFHTVSSFLTAKCIHEA